MRGRYRTEIETAVIVAGFCLGVATLAAVPEIADLGIDLDPSGRALTFISAGVTLLTTVLMFGVLVSLTWIGRQEGGPASALYWPIFVGKICVTALLILASINAVDLLAHDLTPAWRLGRTPAAVLIRNCLLLGYALTSGIWLNVLLLRGREWQAGAVIQVMAWSMSALVLVGLVIVAVQAI